MPANSPLTAGRGPSAPPLLAALWSQLLVFVILSLAMETTTVAAVPEVWPDEFLDEADLYGVWFIDGQTGWAVGDRGVIWRSPDGGQRWSRQPSPPDILWRDICFVDSQHGWLVGTHVEPLSTETQGVIWRTEDGGEHWEPVPSTYLPGLHAVRFTDRHHGWAVGLPSPLFPTGVFTTEDGGMSWQTVRGEGLTAGHAVAAGADGQIWIAGDRGLIGRLAQRTLRAQRPPQPGTFRVIVDGPFGTLSGGHLGELWSRPPGVATNAAPWQPDHQLAQSLKQALGDTPDAIAATIHDQTVWMSVSPSGCLVRGSSAGDWQVIGTGQSSTLRDLHFTSPDVGWGVGDSGTIVRTADGGRTWTAVRGGQRATAILICVSELEQIPWELIVQQTAHQGYRCRVVVCADLPGPVPSQRLTRAAAALQLVGSGGIDWLPGADRAESLALQIRQHRPVAIYAPPSTSSGSDRSLRQTVDEAIRLAADPQHGPPALTQLGLRPWQVRSLICPADPTERNTAVGDPANPIDASSRAQVAATSIRHSQIVYPLGMSIGQLVREATWMLTDSAQPRDDVAQYQILLPGPDGWKPVAGSAQDLLSRLTIARGTPGRRPLGTPLGNLAETTALGRRTMQIQQLLLHAQQDSTALQRMTQLTFGLGEAPAARLMVAVAQSQLTTGQTDAARQTLQELLGRFPQSPCATWARRQLLYDVSSDETLWRDQQRTLGVDERASVASATGVEQESASNIPSVLGAERQQVIPAGNLSAERTVPRSRRAAQLLEAMQKTHPALALAPEVRMSLAALWRAENDAKLALTEYRKLLSQTADPAWKELAQCEIFLSQGRTTQFPKSLASIPSSTARPHLDGDRNEPLWEQAVRLELTTTSAPAPVAPTQIWLTSDTEYLYLAAECPPIKATAPDSTTADNGEDPAAVEPVELDRPAESLPRGRRRDEPLDREDRVCLQIDTNRDYWSSWRLEIGESGAVVDRLGEDPSWNPTWYIAHATPSGRDASTTSDETVPASARGWSFEAAIPWRALVANVGQPDQVWCVVIERSAPGGTSQSWVVSSAGQSTAARTGYWMIPAAKAPTSPPLP